MLGTARDLGLRFDGQRWEPKPCWVKGCSSWYIAWRCFLSNCSSLDACVGVRVINPVMDVKIFWDEFILFGESFTSSSERCTLAPSLFATGVPPSTVGMITTPDWLFLSCPSWLGGWVESCWKVELLFNAGKMADHCQYHVNYHRYTMTTGLARKIVWMYRVLSGPGWEYPWWWSSCSSSCSYLIFLLDSEAWM